MKTKNKTFPMKKSEMEFKHDCFAFRKENYEEGCDALIRCVCKGCSFYATKQEFKEKRLQYPYNERYLNTYKTPHKKKK